LRLNQLLGGNRLPGPLPRSRLAAWNPCRPVWGRRPCWARNRRRKEHQEDDPGQQHPRPDDDDEPLSDADRAALERAAAEPGVVMTADEFAALLDAAGDDAEPRDAFGLTEAEIEAALTTFERSWNEGRRCSPLGKPRGDNA
jgi:hypothetical protein